jgi:hypothetical protein
MSFPRGPRRGPIPPRFRGPVFAVGQHVSVTCQVGQPRRIVLMDDADGKALGSLADGTEVEILAWRPDGSGTRYEVRAMPRGLEGWLAVDDLRNPHAIPATPEVDSRPPTARASTDPARRFGQR